MSDLSIQLRWERAESDFQPGTYSGSHVVTFNDGTSLGVDAAPDWGGDANQTNPEQALASALSSCQMLTFLALAAKAGWPVSSYTDRAVAHLGKNPKGRMSVTRIDLRPVVGFDQGFAIDAERLNEMHHRAHRYCFIANTLADSVEITLV